MIRQMRKLLALAVLLILPVAVQAQFTFMTNADSTIIITGYTGSDSTVVIPAETNGHPVTSIGFEAFYSSSISTVSIPNTVTQIGISAFAACYNLTAIMVGASNSAYASVEGVLFDKNQTTLIQCPGGKVGSYTIPQGITTLEDRAFSDCYQLTSIHIPSSVMTMGMETFNSCDGLTEITVDASNPTYHSVAGILFNAGQTALLQYPAGRTGDYVIPNCVTSIAENSFNNCRQLAVITIPNSVNNIGAEAFFGCTSLASVRIPDSVNHIGIGAFDSCDHLTSISLPNSITRIEDWTFYACYSLTNITIPDRVTRIGNDAFRSCLSLASINIPNNVTSIGDSAFYDCENLTSVTIGNGITNIEDYAFCYCNLAGVYFKGDAPDLGPNGSDLFSGNGQAVVYYLPGTRRWETTFAGRPTAQWLLPNPTILNFEPNFGLQKNGFGFTISWATNISVAVEACTNLSNADWCPVQTNTLTTGSAYFSDPLWTNYSGRFYRLRSP